jgi:hypothetical protein
VNSGRLDLTRCDVERNQAGGIYTTGPARVADSTVAGNLLGSGVAAGAGINNEAPGSLQLVNVTLSGNHLEGAEAAGGGLANASGAAASLWNCSITGNTALEAEQVCGGIRTRGTLQLQNSIVAGNSILQYDRTQLPSDLDGAVTQVGPNQLGGDPGLASLTDNGGPFPTELPLSGSAGLDAVDPADAPPFDARGAVRPFPAGGRADLGAVEASPQPLLTLSGGVPQCAPGASPVPLDPSARLFVADGVSLNGGRLEVILLGDRSDALELVAAGGPEGVVSLQGPDLYYGTIRIGDLTGGGPGLSRLAFAFNGAATVGAVHALLRSVAFAGAPGAPAGIRTVTWQLWDGAGLSTGVVSSSAALVPSGPLGTHPAAADLTYQAPYAAPFTVAAPGVLAGYPGGSVIPVLLRGPEHGDLQLLPDGSFSYRADLAFGGTDDFQYALTDGLSVGPPGTVRLVVAGSPGASSRNASVTGRASVTFWRSEGEPFRIHVETDRHGTPHGQFSLGDGIRTTRFVSERIGAVQVQGTTVRIYAVARERRQRDLPCVLDLTQSLDGQLLRVELAYPADYDPQRQVLGPAPLLDGLISVRGQ